MSTVKILNRNNVSVVDERQADIEGKRISYIFYRFDFVKFKRFAIAIELEGEFEISFVGENEISAMKIYDSVCRNTVTPCTLDCVVEDFFREIY